MRLDFADAVGPVSSISTDVEMAKGRYPVIRKLDLSLVREHYRTTDVKSPSNVTSARDQNSAPSTPLFMPSPKSLRSSRVTHAVLRQSLTKEVISALSHSESSVSSIAEKYSHYLTSPEFKSVTLRDYSLRTFNNNLLLEAIVEHNDLEMRVIAEGHDLPHKFADSLSEELLGCATSATLEQVLQFNNHLTGDHLCLVVVRTQALATSQSTVTVGLASSTDSALTAALKAVCAGLSKVKNLEISSLPRRPPTSLATPPTSPKGCFCFSKN
jgi:hypothetical protein